MVLILTALSLYMTGVIWVVQLLVYPNFGHFSDADFKRAMEHHTKNISLIVMLPMLAELGISVWWMYVDLSIISFTNGVIVTVIWVSTFLLQVPAHNKLQVKKDSKVIHFLIRWNWLRTIGWTVKSLLLIGFYFSS